MKIVTYLDQIANSEELANLTFNFYQNCYIYGDEDLKGIDNISKEYDFETLPICMLKQHFKGTYIYIFNCPDFYGERLLVVIDPILFNCTKMEKLFECKDCVGIDSIETNDRKQVRIITHYRANIGLLSFEIFKERL